MNSNYDKRTKKTGEYIRWLMRLPEFKLLLKLAREAKNRTSLMGHIDQIRKRFNLSIYWESVLENIIVNPRLEIEKHLGSGIIREPYKKDQITGQQLYTLIITPEATQKDLVRDYSKILSTYNDDPNIPKIHVKSSKKTWTTLAVMRRIENGESIKSIASNLGLIAHEVTTIRYRFRKKISRMRRK